MTVILKGKLKGQMSHNILLQASEVYVSRLTDYGVSLGKLKFVKKFTNETGFKKRIEVFEFLKYRIAELDSRTQVFLWLEMDQKPAGQPEISIKKSASTGRMQKIPKAEEKPFTSSLYMFLS